MSTNRIRHLLIAMIAVLAFSAVAAGAAQAARPVQPTFWHLGVGIGGNLKIEDKSMRSRLWSIGLGTVIVCASDTSKGVIEPKGRDTGEVIYTGCKVFAPKENALAQEEEGEELVNCGVKSIPTGAAGEIIVKGLKTRLVWGAKGTSYEKLIFDLYTPEVAPFVELEITGGATCLPKGKYKVEGSVLGWVPRINEEAIMGDQLIETLNATKKVLPRFTKWEVEEGGTLTTGTAELKLGTNVSALETTEQLELEATNPRGLWDVHE